MIFVPILLDFQALTSLVFNILISFGATQFSKPDKLLNRLSQKFCCSKQLALVHLVTKWTFPHYFYHPSKGIVYRCGWKHYVIYGIFHLRQLYFVYAAIFICDWSHLSRNTLVVQTSALCNSALAFNSCVSAYTCFFRRDQILYVGNKIDNSMEPQLIEFGVRLSSQSSDLKDSVKMPTFFQPSREA